MIKIGIIGWRGLVGKIFLNRIKNNIFLKFCEFFLFSTNLNIINKKIFYAYNFNLLKSMDILICCQGSNYTKKVLKKLKNNFWKGYWIDASSYLRMNKDCNLILDPLNKNYLLRNLSKCKIYSGSNCTVSLCLLALKKLIQINLIDWVYSTSYQAISGAGSLLINKFINEVNLFNNLSKNFLYIEKEMKKKYKKPIFCNAIPWIDKKVNFSQTKEEWKSKSEAEKILRKNFLLDSTCVRISSLRCHSQNFIIKLSKNISLDSIYEILNYDNIVIIKNNFNEIEKKLNPFYISSKLEIYLGRIKKSLLDSKILNIFSVGDQLLWGAAEPIKRFLEIILEYLI